MEKVAGYPPTDTENTSVWIIVGVVVPLGVAIVIISILYWKLCRTDKLEFQPDAMTTVQQRQKVIKNLIEIKRQEEEGRRRDDVPRSMILEFIHLFQPAVMSGCVGSYMFMLPVSLSKATVLYGPTLHRLWGCRVTVSVFSVLNMFSLGVYVYIYISAAPLCVVHCTVSYL